MPIATGSLTQRLQQFLADISTFFTTIGEKMDLLNTRLLSVNNSIDILVNPNAINGFTNIRAVIAAMDALRGGQPGVRPTIASLLNEIGGFQDNVVTRFDYLTQAGDGTPLRNNIDSLAQEVFRLGGSLPDHATLWDLRQALVSPTGPRLQTIIEKLDILLDEKLGDPTSPLTMIGLTALIQACICSIDEKTPPIEPPPPTPGLVPVESLCAAGLRLLWTITPSNWRQDAGGTWYAAPNTIAAAGVGYTLEDFDAGAGQGILELVVADMENINRLTECGVAVSLETGSLQTIVRQGYTITNRNPDEAIDTGLTSNADNLFNTPSGCATIQLIGVEGVADAMRFEGVLRPGASFPPLETIWFYELPPN